MYNFGFNISLRNTPREIRELGRACLNTGLYRAIEVTYYEDMDGVDTFAYNAEIREMVQKNAPMVTVHLPAFNLSEENCALRSAILHEFDHCCQYARALGGHAIVMHCGRIAGALHVPCGTEARDMRAWDLSVRMYRKACAIAADYGMEIYAENLNPHDLTMRTAQVRQMVEEVDRDNLHIVFDIGHCAQTGGDIPQDVADAGEQLKHLHLHDYGPAGKHLPLGEGEIDYRAFISALCKVRYTGIYMMELMRCTPENLLTSRAYLLARLQSQMDA